MSSILRKLSLASAMLAAATLAAVPALAATPVTVPFSFVAAGKLCPAGQYNLERNRLNGLITLRSLDSTRTFAWVAGPGATSPASDQVVLNFDTHGQVRYLHSIQYGPSVTGRLDRNAPEWTPSRVMEGQ